MTGHHGIKRKAGENMPINFSQLRSKKLTSDLSSSSAMKSSNLIIVQKLI